ncbi:MAG: hypothetical protein GY769_25505, partial [bacterium]|nr:hypothetical protein [bacterium]
GHSIVVPGYGLLPDSRHAFSPGGSFPASELGCTSCHDPHGNASFRMLHGEGSVAPGTPPFTRPAPTAEGLDLLTGSESNSNHTAYQAGMSEWCANCHGRYHDQSGNFFDHPVDENLETEVVTQYNQYNGDDDPIGGFQATAYLAAVPFEDTTNTITSTFGPSAGSRLMCLTCHRAHASSAPAAGRWDFNVTLLQEDGLASGSYPIPDPYLSPNQGTLCAKCHEGGPPS